MKHNYQTRKTQERSLLSLNFVDAVELTNDELLAISGGVSGSDVGNLVTDIFKVAGIGSSNSSGSSTGTTTTHPTSTTTSGTGTTGTTTSATGKSGTTGTGSGSTGSSPFGSSSWSSPFTGSSPFTLTSNPVNTVSNNPLSPYSTVNDFTTTTDRPVVDTIGNTGSNILGVMGATDSGAQSNS